MSSTFTLSEIREYLMKLRPDVYADLTDRELKEKLEGLVEMGLLRERPPIQPVECTICKQRLPTEGFREEVEYNVSIVAHFRKFHSEEAKVGLPEKLHYLLDPD
jgi:hypothetical protein